MPLCRKHLHQNTCARVGFGLFHDVANVFFDRGQAKRQGRRNFLVGPTPCETLNHHVLTLRELKALGHVLRELYLSTADPF